MDKIDRILEVVKKDGVLPSVLAYMVIMITLIQLGANETIQSIGFIGSWAVLIWYDVTYNIEYQFSDYIWNEGRTKWKWRKIKWQC